MKKSIRFLAAAVAASAAISCMIPAASAAGTETNTVISAPVDDGTLDGGWSVTQGQVSLNSNPDAKKALKKALKGLIGVKYEAIALLGTQIVAGTNYCILCRTTAVSPSAQPEIKLVYIYEDLKGKATITGIKTIIGQVIPGGFSANTGKFGMKSNPDVYKSYKKAMNGFVGVSYTPVAFLGTQVVAGTNSLILCRSRVVYPDAPYYFSLVTVYKDLKGKSEVINVERIALGETDDDIADIEDNGNENSTTIANPWQEYSSVSDACKASGVDFKAPDAVGNYKLSLVLAMKGMIDVRYMKGEREISVRKAPGKDDISGVYDSYENTYKKKIGGVPVTLKMNGDVLYLATWTDGTNSYAYFARDGISLKGAASHIISIIKSDM